jgi:hypothetical protein
MQFHHLFIVGSGESSFTSNIDNHYDISIFIYIEVNLFSKNIIHFQIKERFNFIAL